MNIISYAIGLNSSGGSSGGGGDTPPASALNLTGDISYMFASSNWDWFVEKYKNQITTTKLTSLNNTFKASELSTIPFSLNGYTQNSGCDFYEVFQQCSNLTSIPTITGKVLQFYGVFKSCYKLTTIPDSLSELDFTLMNTENRGHNCGQNFEECKSLRYIPKAFLQKLYGNSGGSGSYVPYYFQFTDCYSLDVIDGLAVQQVSYSNNKVGNYDCFDRCYRLKTMKFDMNTDGTPKTAPWKNQSVDLSKYVGYALGNNIFNGVFGFTNATRVEDTATYEALKNNADYWTGDINYSRYNHDSAVETINSLPDTSAYIEANGGTNTIKFMGESGKLTDGGAINTLTEEEIAVAVSKGWGVAFV